MRVKVDGKWGFIDKNGQQVIGPTYDVAEDFSEGLASVGIKGDDGYKYGYINPRGDLVIQAIYDTPANFIEGIAYVIHDDHAHYIDKNGKEVAFRH